MNDDAQRAGATAVRGSAGGGPAGGGPAGGGPAGGGPAGGGPAPLLPPPPGRRTISKTKVSPCRRRCSGGGGSQVADVARWRPHPVVKTLGFGVRRGTSPLRLVPLLQLLALALAAGASAAVPRDLSQLDKPDRLLEVTAALGQTASLPCAIRPASGGGGAVQMLLWYSEAAADTGAPIYRVDARGRPLTQARLWSSPAAFGPRARLVVDSGGDLARLVVSRLRDGDHGVYRCRADFRDAPTRNTRVSLFVTLPPTQLRVTRWPPPAGGRPPPPLDMLPPFYEGDEVSLSCEAVGGRPRPAVVWLLSDVVVDESYEDAARGDAVVNRLVVPALGRQHLHARLVCRASNDPGAAPTERELFLDLFLRPLSVRIVGRERALLAGQSYEFQCRCSGSRPAANVTWWWKGAGPLKAPVRKLPGSATETISVLTLTAAAEDHGRQIECRAENALFADSEIRDQWQLDVQYSPRVAVRLGEQINASSIRVGGGVYLECSVDANPAAGLISWTHNNVELRPRAGVVLSGRSLVLQHVVRGSAGLYACSANNSVGRGHSQDLGVSVQFPPECAHAEPVLLGARIGETVRLPCAVHALPAARWFRWLFNETRPLPDAARALAAGDAGGPGVDLTPAAATDYGTYACWAENAVGQQARPCLVSVVPAEVPLPPSNCSMARLLSAAERPSEIRLRPGGAPPPPGGFSFGAEPPPPPAPLEVPEDRASVLRVDCRPPPPSGLPESFQMLLVREPQAVLRYNVTLPAGAAPVWELPWAPEPGASYSARLYTVSGKGRSEATVLEGGPLRGVDPVADPANQTGSAADPLLNGLVAAACGLLLVASGALFAIVACRPRRRRRGPDHPDDGDPPDDGPAAATSLLLLREDGGGGGGGGGGALLPVTADDADPDVIPVDGVAGVPRASSSRTRPRPGRAGRTPLPPRRAGRAERAEPPAAPERLAAAEERQLLPERGRLRTPRDSSAERARLQEGLDDGASGAAAAAAAAAAAPSPAERELQGFQARPATRTLQQQRAAATALSSRDLRASLARQEPDQESQC